MRHFFFKGVDSRTHGYVLKIERPLLPGIEPKKIKVPNRPGVYVPKIKPNRIINETEIKVRFALLGATRADFRSKVRAVANWFFNNADPAGDLLYISDEPNRLYTAHIQGEFDIEEIAETGEFDFSFLLPQPFAEAASARVIPWTGTTNITYNGTAPAFPTVIVTPAADLVDYTLEVNGEVFVISYPFTNGEAFTIDMAAGEVYRNSDGLSLMPHVSINSNWTRLDPGGSYTLTAYPTTNVDNEIRFTERFV